MKKFITLLFLSITLCSYSANANTPRPSAPDGEITGHGYVDLGLPSGNLWATCNIDAESPYYPGTYFAWGETQGRDYFRWLDYEYLEEWHTDADGDTTYTAADIGEVISGTEYDAARAQWSDPWRIPSEEDWEELNEYCSMEYKEYSSIPVKKGMLVCGPNGNSIFLTITYSPRYIDLGPVRTAEYWTGTVSTALSEDKYPAAVMMTFDENSTILRLRSDSRHEGFAIRPIISRHEINTSVATLTDSSYSLKYENGKVSINGYGDACELKVSDLSGRIIYATTLNDGKHQLPQLPKGIYLANIYKTGKAINSLKIAVK